MLLYYTSISCLTKSQSSKSQLAIEYGHRIHREFPDTWIFWVDAETPTKIEQGYRTIANAVRISGRNDKDADIMKLVYDWLQDASKASWVLILDNADDKDVFSSPPPSSLHSQTGKQMRDFLPQSSNGNILITSRSRDAAVQVTCNYKHIFLVEEMIENEAMAVLQSQLDGPHPESEMKLLLETLGHVPLAIVQAAANISRRSLPIPDYLEELRRGNEYAASVLDESSPQLRRDSQRSHSIVATWKVTFEYVRRTAPSAARLLSLMCMFDRQGIPSALLETQYGEEVIALPPKLRKVWWRRRPHISKKRKPGLSVKSLPRDFEEDWLTLRDFSMVKMNRNRQHFSMHPMVQFTTKKWLVSHNELDSWSHQFLAIMNTNFHSSGEPKLCEPYIAHANAAIPYRPKDAATLPLQNFAFLTSKMARYYYQRWAPKAVEKLYFLAVDAFDIALGVKSPESLKCHEQRGLFLDLIGQHSEAESVLRRVLAIRCEVLGKEHRDTLETMDLIGDALARQDQYKEAEELHLQALEHRLRIFGPAHDLTQSALDRRALFLSHRGRYRELYETLNKARIARGTNDNAGGLSWVKGLDLISLRLMVNGKLAEAEPYLREAIAEREKKAPDADLMATLNRLARALAGREEYNEAEALFQRILKWYDSHVMNWYEERLQTMADLSYVLSKMNNKLEEAEMLARRCLMERTERNGPEHCDTLWSTSILAGVLENRGRLEEAVHLHEKAYQGSTRTMGETHEDTRDYQRNLERVRLKLQVSALESENKVEQKVELAGSNELKCASAQEDVEFKPDDRLDFEAGPKVPPHHVHQPSLSLGSGKVLNVAAYEGNASLQFGVEDTSIGLDTPTIPPPFPASVEKRATGRIAMEA